MQQKSQHYLFNDLYMPNSITHGFMLFGIRMLTYNTSNAIFEIAPGPGVGAI